MPRKKKIRGKKKDCRISRFQVMGREGGEEDVSPSPPSLRIQGEAEAIKKGGMSDVFCPRSARELRDTFPKYLYLANNNSDGD